VPTHPITVEGLSDAFASVGWVGGTPSFVPIAPSLSDRSVGDALTGYDPADDELQVVVVDQVISAGFPLGTGVHLAISAAAGGAAGWLPLACSLAVSDAIRASAQLPVEVEWPNVLSIPGAMCGGSAGSQRVGSVDTSLNESHATIAVTVCALASISDLNPGTTSLLAAGGTVNRERLIAHILIAMRDRLRQWRATHPELHADYRARCRTVGQLVDGGWVSDIDDRGDVEVTAS